MCQFLSVIALRNGEILWDQYTDSHEQLIGMYELNDSEEPSINRFVRIEYKPENIENYDNPEKYFIKVDESQTPLWFEEIRETIEDKLQSIIKRIILKDVSKKYLLSGVYILTGNTRIDFCVNTRIISIYKTSKVGDMRGTSKVGNMFGTSEVGVMRETSEVGQMRGTSKVGEMWENSKVGQMRETSEVGQMWGTSKVGDMRETSKVGQMRETSEVGQMWGTSKVGQMRGTSKIGEMWGTSKIGEMCETSEVGQMRGTSEVGQMWENSKVGQMWGTSQEVIGKDYRLPIS